MVTPSASQRPADGAARVEHLGERAVGEQARDRQRQLGRDAVAVATTSPPPISRRRSAALDHRLVVDADDDQVVAVVGDGRAEGAALEPEPADEAEADAPGLEVALEDGDLREVARGVGDRERRPTVGELVDERRGDDLARHEPDHARAAAGPGNPQEAASRSRATCTVRFAHSGTATAGISPTGRPRFSTRSGTNDSRSGRKRMSAWRPGAIAPEMVEAVVGGGVERRHHERVLGRQAERDRLADDRVDVAVLGDVLGLAVVGAERHPVRAVLERERQQRAQVAGARGLADQEPHPGAQPLAALLDRRRLVVGLDPGRRVRVQRLAGEPRRVPVDVRREPELRELLPASPRRRRGSSSSRRARARASAGAALRGRRASARAAATRSETPERTTRP